MDFDNSVESITPTQSTTLTVNGKLYTTGGDVEATTIVSPTGTNSSSALPITTEITVINPIFSTVGCGVIIPASVPGEDWTIINRSIVSITIYPQPTVSINGGVIGGGIVLAAKSAITLITSTTSSLVTMSETSTPSINEMQLANLLAFASAHG